MDEPTLLTFVTDQVKVITINRPARRNALNPSTACELRDLLEQTAGEPDIRAVVLTGNGGAFCSGADLKEGIAVAGQEDLLALAYNPIIRAIRKLPKPVVASVDGPATGYGCSLAMACDLRVASDRARFSLAFVRVGLMVDGGASYLMPRLVGMRAAEYAFTGDFIPAVEAERIGLVNHVYPAAELETKALELARRLAAQAPLALAATKEALLFAETSSLNEALEHERNGQLNLFTTEDVREGVMAFMEKRSPAYKGC